MFIRPDENIIVMDDDFYAPYSPADISRLVDAGIKTIHVPHAICWDKLQNGWSDLDSHIDKFLNVGLKVLLPFYYTIPLNFPDNWYIIKDSDPIKTLPNFNHSDYCEATDEFANNVLDHLSDVKDKVQLTFAIPSGGEFLWDAEITSKYPMSDETIFKFIIDRQRLLVEQHGEIWLYLHNFLGAGANWNNTRLPLLYAALRNEFPETPIYSVQFAHFTTGNVPNYEGGQMRVKEYNEKYGIQFFVGSDYCEGLTKNFDAAMEQKVRGFLTSPIHGEHPKKHQRIEPWMVDALRTANQRVQKVRDDRNQV